MSWIIKGYASEADILADIANIWEVKSYGIEAAYNFNVEKNYNELDVRVTALEDGSGGSVQIQSDLLQTDENEVDFVKGKDEFASAIIDSIAIPTYTADEETLTLNGTVFSISDEWQTKITDPTTFNNLTASVGADTYPLIQSKQNSITGTLPNGVNSTLTIESPVSGKVNETILHFSTNATAAPTLVYSGFTPVWLGGTALSMKISKKYTVVFEQVEVSTGVWLCKSSWGEY